MKLNALLIAIIAINAIVLNAQTQSDSSDAVWSIVMPLAVSQNIDMKQCLVFTSKDSLVSGFMSNTGAWNYRVDSIYFRGADAFAFGLVSGFPKYIVVSGGNHAGEFRFKPLQARLYTAEIVVITQADTLIQNIQGVGVQPQLQVMANIINFGIVKVGNYKDTLQAVTIKNISSFPLTITNTKHNKPNDIDFTTLAGGGNFTLTAGETRIMDLQFKPRDAGRTCGVLEFYFNGVGSPASVQLFGEGVKSSPNILSNITALPDLICKSYSESELLISNTGGSALIISKMTLKGINPADFSITGSTPLTIEPDSSAKIIVTFIPKTNGQKSANIELTSNADPDSVLTIPLSARKDSVSLMPETATINLGYLCLNETKDTTITVTNTGTIPTGGSATATANINLKNNYFKVNTGANYTINLHFNGLSNEGVFSEKVTVTDSLCGYSKDINITGEVAQPFLDVDGITITALVGTTKDDKIIIKNNSKRDFTIAKAPAIASPFQFVGNPFPISVSVGSSATLPIRYTPDDNFNDSTTFTINAEPCSINKSVVVVGIPAFAQATLQSQNIEGYPGDVIELPIILNNQVNIQLSGATSLKSDLSFNSTLLWPMDYANQAIDGSTAKIILENLPLNKSLGEPLTNVRFKVGLGNAEGCNLTLSNAKTVGGVADISLINGHFKLLGVCPEGGPRLINSSGAGLFSLIMNPSSSNATIEYALNEKGRTKLFITNSIGETVKMIVDMDNKSYGLQKANIDLSGLSSGKYYVVMQTPSMVRTIGMEVIK